MEWRPSAATTSPVRIRPPSARPRRTCVASGSTALTPAVARQRRRGAAVSLACKAVLRRALGTLAPRLGRPISRASNRTSGARTSPPRSSIRRAPRSGALWGAQADQTSKFSRSWTLGGSRAEERVSAATAAASKAGAARTTSKPSWLSAAAAARPVNPAPTTVICASVSPSSAAPMLCLISGLTRPRLFYVPYTHIDGKHLADKVVDNRIIAPEMRNNSRPDSIVIVAFAPRARWKPRFVAHCLFTGR